MLRIGITQIALVRDERTDAAFALMINTYARLIGLSDQETLWSNEQIAYFLPRWTFLFGPRLAPII